MNSQNNAIITINERLRTKNRHLVERVAELEAEIAQLRERRQQAVCRPSASAVRVPRMRVVS